MKIVLDNTILVRAHEQAHGLGRELLTSLIESKHVLLLSNEMLHELATVLRYPRLQEFFGLTEDLVYNYVAFLRRSAEIVTLNPLQSCCPQITYALGWILARNSGLPWIPRLR